MLIKRVRSCLKTHSTDYSIRYCVPSLFVRMRHVYPSQGHPLIRSSSLPFIFFSYVLCPRLASGVLVVPVKTQRFSFSSQGWIYKRDSKFQISQQQFCTQIFISLRIKVQNERRIPLCWLIFLLEALEKWQIRWCLSSLSFDPGMHHRISFWRSDAWPNRLCNVFLRGVEYRFYDTQHVHLIDSLTSERSSFSAFRMLICHRCISQDN